jgi:hypothetical protein
MVDHISMIADKSKMADSQQRSITKSENDRVTKKRMDGISKK